MWWFLFLGPDLIPATEISLLSVVYLVLECDSASFLVGNLSHLFGPDSGPSLSCQVISSSLLLSKVARSFKCWLKAYLYLGKGGRNWGGRACESGIPSQCSVEMNGDWNPNPWALPCQSVCVCVCVCVCVHVCVFVLSHSVVSDSLQPHALYPSSIHGIFQAKILEWVAISSSRGSSRPRAWTWVSCVPRIGRQILYPCTTWEAHLHVRLSHYSTLPPHTNKTEDFPSWKTLL